jgi:hypothetical protein
LLLRGAGPFFWASYAVSLFALLLSTRALLSSPIGLTLALVALFSSERLLIAAATPKLDTYQVVALLAYHEVVFPAIAVLGLRSYLRRWLTQPRSLRLVDLAAAALAIVVALGFFLSSAPLQERLIYARRFLVLPLTYLAARVVRLRQGDSRLAIAIVVAGGIGVASFGLVERFSPPGTIWGGLVDPNAYYATAPYSGAAPSGPADVPATVNGLPFAFWSFEGGFPSRRLVSSFLEAPTLSLFLSLVLLLGLALALDVERRRRPWLLPGLTLIAIALVLTLGKGGWALALAGSVYLFVARIWPWTTSRPLLLFVAGSTCTGLIVVAALVELLGVDSGLRIHLAGLSAGLDIALSRPLGLGLGSSGVFSTQPVASAGESMIGVLLAQLGWLGAVGWVAWLVAAGLAVAAGARPIPHLREVGLAVGTAMVLLPATATLTESVGGLIGMWAFGFVTGLVASDVCAHAPGPSAGLCNDTSPSERSG